MRLLLDTNICVYLLNRSFPKLTERVLARRPDELAISAVTAAELAYGAAKSEHHAKSQARLELLLSELPVVAFDDHAAAVYGGVRADLSRKGTPIGPLDTLIAAHALALGTPLVTNNVREFRRVPGLTVENWVR